MNAPLWTKGIKFQWTFSSGNLNDLLYRRRDNINRVANNDGAYGVVYHLFTSNIIANFEACEEGYGVECNNISRRLMDTPRHKVRVYYDAEKKTVTVIDSRKENLNERVCAIMAAIPAIVGIDLAELGVPHELFSLVANQTEANAQEYTKRWMEFTNAKELQKQIWIKQVQDTLRHRQQRSIIRYEESERNARHALERIQQDYLRSLNVAQTAAYALWAAKNNPKDDTALMDFVTKLTDVAELSTDSSGNLVIQFATPIATSDDHLLQRSFNDAGSFINRHIQQTSRGYNLDEVIFNRLIKKVLKKEDYILHFSGKFVITDQTVTKQSPSREGFGMPNPHIYRYSCWAQAFRKIENALQEKNDDVLALSYLISAVSDLNIGDSAGTGTCISLAGEAIAQRSLTPCLKDKQGNKLTWKEAYNLEKNIFDRESEASVTVAAQSADEPEVRAV